MSTEYTAVITDDVWNFIDSNVYSEKIAQKILEVIDLLENFPEMGRVYDPEYVAARPPFSCRSFPIPDSPFVLYYSVNEEVKELAIFSMQFQRADPSKRF